MECKECSEKVIFCWEAFTNYICKNCNKSFSYPNTCIPKLCENCSQILNTCERCLEKL